MRTFRRWLKAISAAAQFPFVWWKLYSFLKQSAVGMRTFDRMVNAFYLAIQVVGTQYEIALIGFPKDK